MKNKTKLIAAMPLLLFTFFIGRWANGYFMHSAPPQVALVGISDGGSYGGVLSCAVQGDSDYKVNLVTLSLDGKQFEVTRDNYVNSTKFELPFEIDTAALADGEHEFCLMAKDASYRGNEFRQTYHFTVDNRPLAASFLDQEYVIDLGRTIHAKINANKPLKDAKVKFMMQEYDFYPEAPNSTVYECFIPVDCEENSGEYTIAADLYDHVGSNVTLTARAKINDIEFPFAKNFHVDQEKLDDEKEVSMNSRILEEALEQWAVASPKEKMWNGDFVMPTEVQRISTPFAELRCTPQKGRYFHKAIDIVNRPKSVVWASQTGTVIIKDRYLFSGNTVAVDHGLGVITMYYHLDAFADIEVGEVVKKGNPVGYVGSTGYATGAHLHWELRVQNVAVDPVQWTEKTF